MSFEEDGKLRCQVCNIDVYVIDGRFVYHINSSGRPCPNSNQLAH